MPSRGSRVALTPIGSVPEPAAGAMMISGSGKVGFALRRRAALRLV
ncbi:PEPxxWA-CTERM sorting domain-containing protein [Sphingomonas sp. BE138]|nr:PEPxxWA-CTERM sorting domain-containing protein [Sphingomonas sp. BE138]